MPLGISVVHSFEFYNHPSVAVACQCVVFHYLGCKLYSFGLLNLRKLTCSEGKTLSLSRGDFKVGVEAPKQLPIKFFHTVENRHHHDQSHCAHAHAQH